MSTAVETPAFDTPAAESTPTMPRRQRHGRLLLTLLVAACVVADLSVAAVTGRDMDALRNAWQSSGTVVLAFGQLQLAFVWFILHRSRPLRHGAWFVVALVVWRWLVAKSGLTGHSGAITLDANDYFSLLLDFWLNLGALPALALLPFGATLVNSKDGERGQHHVAPPFQFGLRTLMGWFLVAGLVPLLGRFVNESFLRGFFNAPLLSMQFFLSAIGVPIGTAVALGSGRWRVVAAGLFISFGACLFAEFLWETEHPGMFVFVVAPFVALYLLMLLVLRAAGYRLAYRPWWRRRRGGVLVS